MAVDQTYLDQIAASVAALYRGVESALNRAIAARIRNDLAADPLRDKADAIAKLRRAAQTIVTVLNNDAPSTIRQAVADAYAEGYGSALTDLPQEWFPRSGIGQAAARAAEAAPGIATIEALATALHNDIGDVTQNVLRDTLDAFRAVQAESAARIASGAFTRREAAQAAWQRLVDRGVTSFIDSAGRRWSLSSYVEMATRTVVARAAEQAQADRLRGLGIELVYVSDVTQECRLCRPYEGKVLALSGPTGRIQVEHATRDGVMVTVDVVATLAEARARGFQHPNCRHSTSAYLPGVTRLPKQPTADPQGDEARRRQREIERNIRKYKARAESAVTPQARRAAQARVREWQRVLREHLAAHPQLKRLRYREQVGAGNIPTWRGPKGGPVGDQEPPQQLDVLGGGTPLADLPGSGAARRPAERDTATIPGQVSLDDIRPEDLRGIAPKPRPKPRVEDGDFSGLRKVAGQSGSNPGGLYEDDQGRRWYVKTQKSPEHAASEIAAARLYREAGIDAPEVYAGRGAPGLPDGVQTASLIVEGRQGTPDELRAAPGVREGFAADAWLANWDFAGLTYDNVLIRPDGRAVRIDTGGALLYRAMGAPKGSAFGDKVTEWDTLRDPTVNPQSSRLFDGMTPDELIRSVERVQQVTPDRIREIVRESGLPDWVADRLINRREDLLGKLSALRAERDRGKATLARLLDHKDTLTHTELLDRLARGEGSPEERAEWAEGLRRFDALADQGEKDPSHQRFAAKLATAKDPRATTNRRLGQVKRDDLRAAALRALARELERRSRRRRPEGMRQAIRHRTNDEGRQWAERMMPTPRFKRGEEFDAVREYTGNSYRATNNALRGIPGWRMTDEIRRKVELIDSAMQQSHVPEAVITHRGVGADFAQVLGVNYYDPDSVKSLVGKVFREPGYFSTSVGAAAAFGGGFHLMIRIPAGHEGIYVDPFSLNPGERELLLRRDTHYLVHAAYQRKGAWHLEVEVVPDGYTPDPDWQPDPWGDADADY